MNNQQLWQAVLGNLEVSISHGSFNMIRNTSVVDRQENTMVIGVPNIFIHSWISGKIHNDIMKILKQLAPEIKEVHYQVGQQKPVTADSATPSRSGLIDTPAPQRSASPIFPTTYVEQNKESTGGLNPKYTFDTFVVGKNNELAHAASVAVAKNPGTLYNPLFIYGGVGLGKTHLMQAVGHVFLKNNPRAKVLYTTSEAFTNGYVEGLKEKRMEEFKRRHRGVDMLLVDDIHFIGGKDAIQEEFFHTFNELREKGKQIILIGDRSPKDMSQIEQRLVSRFVQGMVADVQAPDLETRTAILRSNTANRGVSLPDDVIDYIAANITSNIRELEGALNKLMAWQQINNKLVDLEQAKQFLADILSAKKKVLSLKKIALSVAEFYNISMEDLLKQSRRKEYVLPRQIAMFLARRELSSSFPTIGEFFGGRDHTTVMHGCEKIENIVSVNEGLKQEIDLILDKLYVVV